MKFIKKYQTFFISFSIIITVLTLRFALLSQPEEQLTYTIHKGVLLEKVKVTGTYSTASQTQVFSPTNGIITKLFVSNQDLVETGDPLFHIESTATKEQKIAASASYQQALTTLQTAKQAKENTDVSMWAKQKAYIDAQNNLNLMEDQISKGEDNPATKEPYTQLEIDSINSLVTKTKKDFEFSENQYRQADQNISSAQALVNSTKLALDATRSLMVYSPSSGKVVNLLKDVGDGVEFGSGNVVNNTSNTQGVAPVLVVTNLEAPVVTAKVSEVDVARLQEGQEAQVVFDADKREAFTGVVKAIDTVGSSSIGSTTYSVRIELDEFSSTIIRPGMTAQVTITTYSKADIISVPNSSIVYVDNQAFIKKANKNKELIKVELGHQGLVKTEITNELPDGLEILAIIN